MTMSPRSTKQIQSVAVIGLGALVVGVISIYVWVSYLSRKDDEGDGVDREYRKDNPDGFQPGDSPIEELSDLRLFEDEPKQQTRSATSKGTSPPIKDDDDKQQKSKTLTLADIIISDPTETTKQEIEPPSLPAAPLPPAVPSSSSLPRTAVKSYLVDGISTGMFVQVFADRIFLGVSQLNGKFGNYLMCQATPDEVNPKHVDYEVTTLLGAREDTVLTVYARQVTEQIEKLHPNPVSLTVILAISLNKKKATQHDVFRSIVDLLVNLYKQARLGS